MDEVRRTSFALILLAFSVPLAGQTVSVGVLGGAPFTNEVSGPRPAPPYSPCTNGCSDNGTGYTIGPSVRVSLPSNLRIEVDALYRPYAFTSYGEDGFSANASGQQWRVPVLLQYRFGGELLRPFAEGGLSFDGLTNFSHEQVGAIGLPDHRWVVGLVAGAGVDLNLRLLHLSGELRYTREINSNFDNASNLNQAEVLFGVHF